MFKSTSGQGELNGFLDAGSHMKGELQFDDTFRIDGKLTGSVTSKGNLVVGEPGEVEGECRVRRAFVSGTVRGTLHAAERVEITSTGKVMADVHTPALVIEEGAFFEGRCFMSTEGRTRGKDERQKVTQMPLAKDR